MVTIDLMAEIPIRIDKMFEPQLGKEFESVKHNKPPKNKQKYIYYMQVSDHH